ncbi:MULTISPECIES: hypothetical protein [unclassified Streptomyces]|uniref:hypothetical protein n=1 Tax=unclassified Streptomyces TaxID=2593676 RepID=UPI002E10B90C
MPTLEKIRPVTGAPCWVNLMAQDLRAAQSFHTDVIGWKFRESILGSNFSVALAYGEPVAGIGCWWPFSRLGPVLRRQERA